MEVYGTLPGGQAVQRVTLRGGRLQASIISYGARLTELWVPGRDAAADIVLGHDSLADYVAGTTYFGATCGRYGNRIAGGRFTLDGQCFELDRNEGGNTLHGGTSGFDRRNWAVAAWDAASVTLTMTSPDGDMGFPGECAVSVSYRLTDDDRLLITHLAKTTRPTVINLVNHAYFNLAGQGSGDVLGQMMQLAASAYTPVDGALLATGEIRDVAGSAFDFRQAKPIGRDFAALGAGSRGYDHNWCLDGSGLRDCALAWDPASGRRLRLRTTEPGVQFYTGGYIDDSVPGKAGRRLGRNAGFTLETQKYPGSPNHANFPTSRLEPGQSYRHEMEFRFDSLPS